MIFVSKLSVFLVTKSMTVSAYLKSCLKKLSTTAGLDEVPY